MKILLFLRTNSFTSGSGSVANNLKKNLDKDLLILSEENLENNNKIESIGLFKSPKFPNKGARFFTWLYLFKFRQANKKCDKIIKEFNPDVILAVYPNEYFLWLAAKAASRHNLPLVTWFHNTYVENRSGIDWLFGKYIQNRVFEQSKLILTISEGLTAYYKTHYPKYVNKFDTLQHGFPPIIYKSATQAIKNNQQDKIRFAFTGSLNSSCIEASTRLFKALSKIDGAELNIFTGYPEKSFQRVIPKDLEYVYHGFIPESEFIPKIQRCKIALIAHGFEGSLSKVEYQTIFPTRTIPLLQSGVPILLHSPKYASFTAFMRSNQCAVIVDKPDEKLLINSIISLLNDKRKQSLLVTNSIETAKYFDIDLTSKRLVKMINCL